MSATTTSNHVDGMDCRRVMLNGLAKKYVSGELDEPMREAFERHYFECDRCFDDVRTHQSEDAQVWRWGWLVAAAAVILLVAGMTAWNQVRRPSAEPATRVVDPAPTVAPSASAATPQTPSPEPVPVMSDLARFDPPGYIAPTLRSSTDPARQQFRDAMAVYQSSQYRPALAGFKAAVDLDASAPDSNFFLGICYLLVGETDAGIHSLRNTIALGDSPFLEEAHFYLAKGLLRQNELTAAQQQLRQAIQLNGDRQTDARRLSEQLSRLQREPGTR